MAFTSILAISFASPSVADDRRLERIPLPIYCTEIDRTTPRFSRDARELECRGIGSFNAGHYRAASKWFRSFNELRFHEEPSPGRFGLLAFSFAQMGEGERAEAAMEVAYIIIMIEAGYIRCDLEDGLFISNNEFTSELTHESLDIAENRMCGEMFYRPPTHGKNGFYGTGTKIDLSVEHVRVAEYEYIRHLTGIGRPLPAK